MKDQSQVPTGSGVNIMVEGVIRIFRLDALRIPANRWGWMRCIFDSVLIRLGVRKSGWHPLQQYVNVRRRRGYANHLDRANLSA